MYRTGMVRWTGLILRVQDYVQRILRTGEVKTVKVVTIKDRTAQVSIHEYLINSFNLTEVRSQSKSENGNRELCLNTSYQQ